MINGVPSSPYRVTRGVRQGDPLSCLLFDIAIEPLACTLRGSALQGFRVPGVVDKILTSLSADDTTVFLSEVDEYGELLEILDRRCKASKAKFNKDKTQVIPVVGTALYRRKVIETRTTRDGVPSLVLPANISITEDGEVMRILGAWIGNGADQMAPWTGVLRGVDKALSRWKLTHSTLRGKRLNNRMIVTRRDDPISHKGAGNAAGY